MKRRVKSFLLAILMVFTILPTNFVTVEAENCDIKIMVDSDKGEELLDSKFTIKVFCGDEQVKLKILHINMILQ